MAQFPSTTSASDVWNMTDVYRARAGNNWPSIATVPSAPTIGTATAGNAQAVVTFTAPSSDGGSAITGYRVTSTPGGITATGSASPITITGLTNGTSYTFTVAAQNAVGYGPESAASNSVTPNSQTYTNRVQFSYTGSAQSWTVPSGVQNIRVLAWGAGGTGGGNSAGGSNSGGNGLGGLAIDCGIAVTAGESLAFYVGQAVAFNGGNGGCLTQSSAFGVGTGGAGGTGDGGGTNGNSGGSGGGSSGITRSGTILCAAGGGGGGGGASPQGAGISASVTTGGTGGTKTGNGTNGAAGSDYAGGGGGGASGSSQGGSGAQAGTGGGNFVPSLPSGYPYTQNTYSSTGTTAGNSGNSDRGGSGNGGSSQAAGTSGVIVIYY